MNKQIIATHICTAREKATEIATVWRNNAVRPDTGPRTVRIFARTVKAGGAEIPVWAVVVYASAVKEAA